MFQPEKLPVSARLALLLLLLLLAGMAVLSQVPPNEALVQLPACKPRACSHGPTCPCPSRCQTGPVIQQTNAPSKPGAPVLGGLVSPDGTEEMQCPLPSSEKKHNVGGKDGAGLCVF